MSGSVESQDYAEQLPMRMGAPAPTQSQAVDTDTTTRPDRLPAQLPAPVNDPSKPMLSATGFDATTVGDTDKTAWSDYAKAAWQRVEGMGAAALGAASLTARKLGANPDTVQHIEQMRAGVAQSIEESINSMTPAAQKALHASVFGGQDENGEHIPTPGEVGWSRFLALNAASFVPDAVLAAVTARAAGAAAMPILGAIYGSMQAGEGYSKLVDEVDKSKPQDWANSPAMQALLGQGVSFDDAKKQIVDHAANQLGALNFGIGALTGAGGMGLLMRGPLGSVGKSLIARLGLSAGEGAVTMGLQSGGQEFAQENATNQVGLTNGFDTDKLARAAASGALGGIVIGAAGGALHGAHDAPPATLNPRGEETATPGPSTGLVSPELQAALDLGDAGTGFIRGQPQGELFRTTEQANAGGNQNLPPASGGPPPARMGDEQMALNVDTPQPAKMAPPGFVGDNQQGQLFRTPEEMSQPRTPPQAPAPQQVQPELMAGPGTVGLNPQGQLFRTAEEANAPGAGSSNVPAGGGAPGAAAGSARPSAGMSRSDLLDALKTMPNQDPKALARMSKGDLAAAYDKAQGPAQPATQPTAQPAAKPAPEPTTVVKSVGKKAARLDKQPDKQADIVTVPEEAKTAPAQEAAQVPAEPPTSSDNPKAETPPAPVAAAAAPMSAAERLKAQRAARKAAMAPPGERMKGVVATVEAEPTRASGTEKLEPRTHEQAMADVEKGVREFKVQPLKKGADITRAMNTVIQELTDKLKGTKTEGDVAETVAKWARSNTNPLPGTSTRRIDIGNHVVQLLTGKSVDEFSGRADRVRSELAREPTPEVRYEKEANREDITEGERTVTHAVGDSTTVVEKEPTKIVDQLPHWLGRVLSGDMTVHEAYEAYGLPKGNGRPRKFATFADYINDRIRMAEDPKVEEDLRARLSELKDMPTSQAKSAETNRINQLLETTGKDAADKLRALKEELDPAKAAADEVTEKPQRAADKLKARLAEIKATKQPPELGRIAQVLHSPDVNRVVTDMLDSGKPHTLQDYLYAIGKDDTVNRDTPELASLARRMMSLAKDNIPVDTNTEFQFANGDVAYHGGLFRPGVEPGTGAIGVNKRAVHSTVETLLHEGLHAITAHYIESLPRNHPDMLALDTMKAELRRVFGIVEKTLDPAEATEISYALENNHELHTMLMTNPAIQRLAAAATPSYEFQSRMKSLGYGLDMVKSVWAAFTSLVRRALGLKGPMNARDASVMDYVLKPLQDITERAADFNRSPPDDVQFTAAHAMPDFRDATRTAIEKVDPAGLNDKARKFWLLSSPLDHIVKWNRDLFESRDAEAPGNSLERFRAATEAVTARSKEFHDKYADTVSGLVKKVAGPDREKLAQLMNDATIANVQLGKGADNSHLTTVGQQDQLRALQSRYNALSPDARGAYDAVKDYYAKTYREERDAQLSGMLKAVLPDATPTQIRAMTEATRTMDGIERMLSDQGDSEVARAFGDAFEGNRKLLRAITKVHKLGFVQGDYFPLRRFGDYVLRYGSHENGDYGVEMFERRSEAEARRLELLKQNQADLSQVLDKRESHLRSMLPESNVVSEISDAMQGRPELREHTDEVRDLINSILLQHATHSERARQSMRRRGVQGASTDIERVLAKDFLATSSRIGYLENGSSRAQALADMRRDSDNLGRNGAAGEQIRAQSVVNELEKRMPSGDDASGAITGVARRFSSLGFVQSLMSPSHMLTSTIEAHMNSTAILGGRHGVARASLAIGKALRDASPALGVGARNTMNALAGKLKAADWNLSTVVRDSMIKRGADRVAMTDLFNKLNAAGLIDHTAIREMQRIANMGVESRRGKALDWWGRFMDLNAAGAHAVDVANKSAVAKAAYDLELAKTKSHDAAVKYAVEMARTAMPNYNLGNKARISTDRGPFGGLAGPMTQFKQYGINMYAMMANLVRSSIHGATSQERMEARKAFAGVLATHTLMAGSLTLLGDPLRWIGGLYDWATGAAKPHDYENDVRSWMADAFGPEVGEVLARGLPHLAGIDIHRRVGLANLLEPPELKSFDKKGYAEAVVSAMTGAAGEDATTMAGGFSKLLGGDITGGLKDLVPRPLRDIMKAEGLATKGVTDSKGQTIMPPEKLSGFDVAAQSVGFQPSKVSEFREGRSAVLEAREEANSEHNHLIHQWTGADPDDRAAIMEDIQSFNVRNPGQKITADTLLKAAKQRRDAMREANAATFGLTLPRKARGYLSNAGSFANTGQ